MTDNTVYRTMLLDFYGELLTEKQREYFDLHYNEDLSLSEIAESGGISRQAVWDIIRRAEAAMLDTERKTGFVAKAIRRRSELEDIREQLQRLEAMSEGEAKALAHALAQRLNALAD